MDTTTAPRSPFREASPNNSHSQQQRQQPSSTTETPWFLDPDHEPHLANTQSSSADHPAEANDENEHTPQPSPHSPFKRRSSLSTSSVQNSHNSTTPHHSNASAVLFQGTAKAKSLDATMMAALRTEHNCALDEPKTADHLAMIDQLAAIVGSPTPVQVHPKEPPVVLQSIVSTDSNPFDGIIASVTSDTETCFSNATTTIAANTTTTTTTARVQNPFDQAIQQQQQQDASLGALSDVMEGVDSPKSKEDEVPLFTKITVVEQSGEKKDIPTVPSAEEETSETELPTETLSSNGSGSTDSSDAEEVMATLHTRSYEEPQPMHRTEAVTPPRRAPDDRPRTPMTPKDRYLQAVSDTTTLPRDAHNVTPDPQHAVVWTSPMSPKDRYLLAVRQTAAKCKTMSMNHASAEEEEEDDLMVPDMKDTDEPLVVDKSTVHQNDDDNEEDEDSSGDPSFRTCTPSSRSMLLNSYDIESMYYGNTNSTSRSVASSGTSTPRFISQSPTVASILMEAVQAAKQDDDEATSSEFGSPLFLEHTTLARDYSGPEEEGVGSPTKAMYPRDESTDGLPVKDIPTDTSPTRSYLQLDVESCASSVVVDDESVTVEDANNDLKATPSKAGKGGPIDTLRTSFAMIWNSKPRSESRGRSESREPMKKEAVSVKKAYSQVSSPTQDEIVVVDACLAESAGTMENLRSSLMMIWGNKPRAKSIESSKASKKDVEAGKSLDDDDATDCKRERVQSEDSDSASSYRKVAHKKSRPSDSLSDHSRGRSTSREALPMGSQYLTSSRGRNLSRDRTITPVPSNEESGYGSLLGKGKDSYDSVEEAQDLVVYSSNTRSSVSPAPMKNIETTDTEDSFINAALKVRNMDNVVVVYSNTPGNTKEWHPPEQERKEHDTMVRAILERPSLIDKSDPEPHHKHHCDWARVRKCVLLALSILLLGGTVAGCLTCGITGKCVRRNDDSPEPEVQQPATSMVLTLPDYTLESLQSLHSAQTKAYLWLEDDPNRHTYTESRMFQRFALATLFYSTKIAQNWTASTSWMSYDIHECYWFSSYEGMDVCENDELKHLVLKKNNLRGNLPPELALLTSLVEIDLSRNVLIGSIPEQLGQLTTLNRLYLEKNELNGAIPSHLGTMAGLTDLGLATNDLKESIPSELGALTNLQKMRVFYNFLTGQIPSELGRLTNLELLDVDVNTLTGTIPTELGQLEMLQELWLDWNSFVGPIPTQLGELKNLVKLFLGRAFVDTELRDDGWRGSGDYSIPSELGRCTKLQELYLDNNDLTGMIPTELSAMTDLQRMTLDNNLLTDSISPGICSLFGADLESLSVDCSEVFCDCGCTCV